MTPKEFAKYLARDKACLHCGETEAIAPQHRQNRGMGGSKTRDVPSNIIVLCSALNGLAESDSRWSRLCIDMGWKLESWRKPVESPVFDSNVGKWFMLDDKFNRTEVER